MRIGKKIKNLFGNKLIDKLPDDSSSSQFFTGKQINHELLQQHLIQCHVKAFNRHLLLLEKALEAGCQESFEVGNRGMVLHSKQIARLSGMNYFADVNAAASRLEVEGYSVVDESSIS